MADDVEALSGQIDGKRQVSSEIKDRLLAINLSSPAAKEWINARRQNIRPWSIFLSTNRLKPPNNVAHISQRIIRNIDYFQSNYIFVFLGLVIYCVLTSPLLLIAVAASAGACYIVKLKNSNQQVKIFGHEVTLVQQYGLVMLFSFPLFYLAGAGSAVFWIIGASFFLIMLHAIFFAIENVNTGEDGFDLQMEVI